MPSLTVNLSAAKFKKQAYAYMLLYLNPIMLYHQAVSIVKKARKHGWSPNSS